MDILCDMLTNQGRARGRVSFTIAIIIALSVMTSASAVFGNQPISIQQDSDGNDRFYDSSTGSWWVPYGANYVKLGWQNGQFGGEAYGHSTFNVLGQNDPSHFAEYDPDEAETILTQMENAGYNLVRVYLSHFRHQLEDPSGPGIHREYILNVVDFLQRAQQHGILVWFSFSHHLPVDYHPASSGDPDFEQTNAYYWTQNWIDARKNLMADFISALNAESAPMTSIFAYSLNEPHFIESQKPLSYTSGLVTPVNGTTYDMASTVDREQMMEDGMNFFLSEIRATVSNAHPGAFFTAGFFRPDALAGPNDDRIIVPAARFLDDSAVSFIDVHIHLHDTVGLSVEQHMQEMELTTNPELPLVIGEYSNSLIADVSTATEAADRLEAMLADLHDVGGDGSLLWSWNPHISALGIQKYWAANDEGELIGDRLSPLQNKFAAGVLSLTHEDHEEDLAGRTNPVVFFQDPVMVLGPLTANGYDAATARIFAVAPQRFSSRVQEWDFLDGIHDLESVGFFGLDRGLVDLGDLKGEAQIAQVSQHWKQIDFQQSFTTTPAVFSQVASVNGPAAVVTRIRNVTASGFEIRLQEQESYDKDPVQKFHPLEDVHWIAIEKGVTQLGGRPFEVGTDSADDSWKTILFTQTVQNGTLIGQVQTFSGADPVSMNYEGMSTMSVKLRLREERSFDIETGHVSEVVAYMILGE